MMFTGVLLVLYEERKAEILRRLELKSVVKLSELVAELGVSMDTIRRDVKSMEKEGLLCCIRGGACLPDKMERFSAFTGREVINIELKREAAAKAVRLVGENDIIFLNSGTTNTIFAQELAEHSLKCTVVTNNMAAAAVLMMQASMDVIVLGGSLDKEEKSTFGSVCERELASYYFDTVFLSVNAVSADRGYTDFRLKEIPIMQTAVNNTRRSVAVMDSSKFGNVAKKCIFGLERVDLLVTDNQASEEKRQELVRRGAELI